MVLCLLCPWRAVKKAFEQMSLLILSIDDIEDTCQCYFSFLRVWTLRVGSTAGTHYHIAVRYFFVNLCYSLFHLVRSTIGTLLPPSPFSGQILNHAMWLASNDNSPDHAGRGKNLKILHNNNIHELCHDGGLALEDAGGLSRPDWSKVFIRGEREWHLGVREREREWIIPFPQFGNGKGMKKPIP